MLKVHCDVCEKELSEPGALLFGPPNDVARTLKRHLCVSCYRHLEQTLARRRLLLLNDNRADGFEEDGVLPDVGHLERIVLEDD